MPAGGFFERSSLPARWPIACVMVPSNTQFCLLLLSYKLYLLRLVKLVLDSAESRTIWGKQRLSRERNCGARWITSMSAIRNYTRTIHGGRRLSDCADSFGAYWRRHQCSNLGLASGSPGEFVK